MGMQTKLDNNN